MHSISLFVMSQSALQTLLDAGEHIIHTQPQADMVLVSRDSIVDMYIYKSTGPRVRFDNDSISKMELLDMLHKATNGAPVAWVETDYFGGAGEQSGILIKDGKITEYPDDINGALCNMGVKKESNMDEFDTIGLGGYRTNDDAFGRESDDGSELEDEVFEGSSMTHEDRLASVFEKIQTATVSCPECEHINVPDYICLTCGDTGGDGVIYILTWIRQNKDFCILALCRRLEEGHPNQ